MKFINKPLVCLVVCLMLGLAGSAAYANPVIKIVNNSGNDLYVYDFDLSKNKPTPLLKMLKANDPAFQLTMQPASAGGASHRIYFASERLKAIEVSGKDSDPFNPQFDGKVMFSFAEYNYEPAQRRYTVDVSYIDVFSYPMTLKFTGAATNVFQNGFEYGPTSFSAIEKALKAQGSPWSDLVWNDGTGMKRIVGPNKVWPFRTANDIPGPPNVPASYRNFYNTLPPNGHQLFGTDTNNYGWQSYTSTDSNEKAALVKTGYFKALLSAASLDNNKKHGFYLSPKDGLGEFTDLNESVQCTITVYSYNK